MDVRKDAGLEKSVTATEEELALINRWSRKELTAEEVYAFTVKLCDNEIDRDGERFTPGALEALAEKFVGKSGIFDHRWSAAGQSARIYKAEVVCEPGTKTKTGEAYQYVKGWAYMLRTPGNADLIAEIEGGIKKEVSVGCAVEACRCSVCGEDQRDRGKCSHVKGRTYNGKLCYGELDGVSDVYEWSFVAVPAQPKAGVMRKGKASRPDLARLEEEAALGRKYLDGLRKEVMRLGALAEPELESPVMKAVTDKLGEFELERLRKVLERRAAQRYPLRTQLSYGGAPEKKGEADGAFLI